MDVIVSGECRHRPVSNRTLKRFVKILKSECNRGSVTFQGGERSWDDCEDVEVERQNFGRPDQETGEKRRGRGTKGGSEQCSIYRVIVVHNESGVGVLSKN